MDWDDQNCFIFRKRLEDRKNFARNGRLAVQCMHEGRGLEKRARVENFSSPLSTISVLQAVLWSILVVASRSFNASRVIGRGTV
ncbi:hypothetical protein ACWIEX_11230 [Bosea sp. NPDC055353]